MIPPEVDSRLRATRLAFDSVAAEYDGPSGNNALIQHLRRELWKEVESRLPAGARLLDLGCGTGIDAAHFGSLQYRVHGVDWSPGMIDRTRARVRLESLERWVTAEILGLHELDRLCSERFDGIYSNLGPLNCALDLAATAHASAHLLAPNGQMTFSVIGRLCPWEILYYGIRGRWGRIGVRLQRAVVPVPLNGHTVWTRYYLPREFFRRFAHDFELTEYRGLALIMPPPYLTGWYDRLRPIWGPVTSLDKRLGSMPLLRNLGDHFLMVLTRRAY